MDATCGMRQCVSEQHKELYETAHTGDALTQVTASFSNCVSASSCENRLRLIMINIVQRYNRRGIQPDGKVANYVESEQIVSIICTDSIHRASFVQVFIYRLQIH